MLSAAFLHCSTDFNFIPWTSAASPYDCLLFMLNAVWICAGSAKQPELLKVSLDRHVLEHDLLHVSSSVGPCGTQRKMLGWISLQHQPRFSCWFGWDFWRISDEFSAHIAASRCVLAFFTDCGFLSTEPKLDMVQCAAAHEAHGPPKLFLPLSHD